MNALYAGVLMLTYLSVTVYTKCRWSMPALREIGPSLSVIPTPPLAQDVYGSTVHIVVGIGAPRDLGNRGRARHEVSHGLVAYVLGATVVGIDIRQSGSIGGTCSFEVPQDLPMEQQCWIRAQIALAGSVSDVRDARPNFAARSDTLSAVHALAAIVRGNVPPHGYIGTMNREALFNAARKQVAGLLREHASVVAQASEVLAIVGTLSASQLRRIFARKFDT